jgi:hypothetical protein
LKHIGGIHGNSWEIMWWRSRRRRVVIEGYLANEIKCRS